MRLLLVPFYFAEPQQLREIEKRLPEIYDLHVQRVTPWFDPEKSFHAGRGQYDALGLLRQLLEGLPEDADRVLAMTGVDLFIPVLTYVFGEAQLDGPTSILSARRLAPQAYGLPADPARFGQRLLTESVHELGHTFGLPHCTTPGCAMHGATYVEEIDLKGPVLCDGCRQDYRKYIHEKGWD